MGRSVVRWVLRVASAAVAALGAYVLHLGLTSLWMAVQVFPGPWNPPTGFAALGGLYLGGLMGAAGVLFTGMGAGLLAAGWYGAGLRLPRLWWRRRLSSCSASSRPAGRRSSCSSAIPP